MSTKAGHPQANTSKEENVIPFARSATIIMIIALLGALGIAIKEPWGHFLMRLAGQETVDRGPRTWDQWLLSTEWGWLMLAVLACLIFHRFSGLRAAPLIERLVFSDPSVPRTRIVRPALAVSLILTALIGIGLAVGNVPPIATNLVSGQFPRDDVFKLLQLWPLGFAGAALSEEVLFRFGIITPVMGAIFFLFGRSRPVVATAAFWIANSAQAFLFGFGHVQDGLVASAAGGWLLATLVAPQTWAGLLFGYVYRRWGIETAILGHALTDIFAPAFVVAWAYYSL